MRFRPEDRYRLLQSRIDAYARLEGVTITRRTALRWTGLASLLATVGCDDGSSSTSGELEGGTGDEGAGTDTSAGNDATSGNTSDASDESGSGSDTSSGETGETGQAPLSLEELMAIIHPWAVELVASSAPDDLGYNANVEALLEALVIDLPDITNGGYDLEELLVNAPIEIFEIHMTPGSVIPLHDHADYIGSIVGVEGSCETINYTQLTQPDPEGWFEVQEVASGNITPGVTGSLGLVEANFHVLQAGPQGAKMVDVFTFFSPSGYSNWAQLDPTPVDAAQKIYRCRWA